VRVRDPVFLDGGLDRRLGVGRFHGAEPIALVTDERWMPMPYYGMERVLRLNELSGED
jgi:hypothetical protein